jgi:trehalose 6-phosphate synthase
LSEEEEKGYYYGFSNEGLWPLCHLAHTRPVFRLNDWTTYQRVNQRFCEQTPESSFSQDSLILVQDYHFALLPRMLRNRATQELRTKGPQIGIFWHIPWPNPEFFGIAPWNRQLLHGMLGSNVVGFHTQSHCNNFLESCNRYLEARIDWERFSVTMEGHETLVRAFPIGIDTAPVPSLELNETAALKKQYGIVAEHVAIGVDRIDYTKGLIERVESVGRFLEKNPEYIGKFTLLQIGSPSRTRIQAYRSFHEELQASVDQVNRRFSSKESGYLPIILLPIHHEWEEIQKFYQLGDLCMVTSLHDGMNLVAKEYVWCQKPEKGTLILSQFTGASRELTEAFIVNPYSIEEMADAIAASLKLSESERTIRMKAMRDKIQQHDAIHWASSLISSLQKHRQLNSIAA